MLNLTHLCHQISRLNQALVGIAAGKHQLNRFWFQVDQFQCLLQIQKAKADCTKKLITDKKIVAAGNKQLLCPDQRFLGQTAVFTDILCIYPAGTSGLDDGKKRLQFFGNQLLTVGAASFNELKKQTLSPRPTARSESPRAAVVFPLPFPVYICTIPCSSAIGTAPSLIYSGHFLSSSPDNTHWGPQ